MGPGERQREGGEEKGVMGCCVCFGVSCASGWAGVFGRFADISKLEKFFWLAVQDGVKGSACVCVCDWVLLDDWG